MPITELLRQNAERYPDDTSLVEITPPPTVHGRLTWKEYALIESGTGQNVRREITWKDFNCQANRFANFLLSRGIRKGEKVAILLMNCLEWLPIYFGILKAGAIAVPLNYRYTAEEIRYCLNLAEACCGSSCFCGCGRSRRLCIYDNCSCYHIIIVFIFRGEFPC